MKSITDRWPLILIGVVSVVIVTAAVFSLSGGGKSSGTASGELVKADSHSLGSRDAKVTLVEFADFECSACIAGYPIVKQITKEYSDKILFVYRHFPIIAGHPDSLKAAEASEAAGEQGKFWEYYDILFSSGGKLTVSDLKKYANELGLDISQFESVLDGDKYKDRVMADLADGEKLGVDSTPTFFINGKKYVGVQTYDQFKRVIEEDLKAAK
jgi:protein-disulfide isomerase